MIRFLLGESRICQMVHVLSLVCGEALNNVTDSASPSPAAVVATAVAH